MRIRLIRLAPTALLLCTYLGLACTAAAGPQADARPLYLLAFRVADMKGNMLEGARVVVFLDEEATNGGMSPGAEILAEGLTDSSGTYVTRFRIADIKNIAHSGVYLAVSKEGYGTEVKMATECACNFVRNRLWTDLYEDPFILCDGLTIRGTVRDKAGEPLKDLTIGFRCQTAEIPEVVTTTDSNGAFEFSDIAPYMCWDTGEFVVVGGEYVFENASIDVTDWENPRDYAEGENEKEVELVCVRPKNNLVGRIFRVVDSETKEPVAGARLSIGPQREGPKVADFLIDYGRIWEGEGLSSDMRFRGFHRGFDTDAEGLVTLPVGAADVYVVDVRDAKYLDKTFWVAVTKDFSDEYRLPVAKKPTCTVSFSDKALLDYLLEDGTIVMFEGERGESYYPILDVADLYTNILTVPVEPGEERKLALYPPHGESIRIEVPEGAEELLIDRKFSLRKVSGVVLDADGRAVENAAVRGCNLSNGGESWAYTNEKGEFTFNIGNGEFCIDAIFYMFKERIGLDISDRETGDIDLGKLYFQKKFPEKEPSVK